MTPTNEIIRRYSGAELASFIQRVLIASGFSSDNALTIAGLMAEADVNGSDGHGIFRLPAYVKRIRAGGLNVDPHIRIETEKDSMALVHGDNTQGHLVMKFCTELAIAKARKSGVAWVGCHHSNHAGPASLYARMPLAQDMIGLYVAVGNANHLPPWGGIEMLLSTNPIAIAVPALDENPIILDMATTVAAYGKVKTAAQRGETMPEGWMVDRNGDPLTDPNKAEDGFLLPIGGPKGYGLALMFGLLAGTLNGAAFGKNVVDFNKDFKTTTNTGQFIVAIDIAAFADVGTFKGNVDNIIQTMKASPTMPGVTDILLPGERSHGIRQDREKHGVPMPDGLFRSLEELAAETGVPGLGK